ncbi:hypothetical protein [Gracilimonas sp.]|uniref:hypothetical protein n=1 Tax=Gracilimonas sp. TaxID=1974203 RepID=UPI0028718CDC|nr:hypothetical protein [Gracilimonas sp.]
MYRILFPLFIGLVLMSASIVHNSAPANSVNAVLGDVSYTETFGTVPDEHTPENIRIKTHLNYVIKQLKNTDTDYLSADQQKKRAHLIHLLEDYTEAENFPVNHHFENRLPVFIDKDGNLCAVGYLLAKTKGLETAQKINKEHKFDYIKDINPHLIDGWLAENGLTKTEAAMIQPAYDFTDPQKQTVTKNNIETEYAIASSILAGAQLGVTTYMMLDNSTESGNYGNLFNASVGAASITLGLINLDNSSSSTSTICPTIGECLEHTTITKNQARTNLSIANIIIGSLSAAFNGYQFFRSGAPEDQSRYNLQPTQLYDPNSQTTSPGLSFSMKF